MTKLAPLTLAMTIAVASAAFAQTTKSPDVAPTTPPPAATSSTPSTAPSNTPSMTAPAAASRDIVLSEAEAKAWVDKKVYSSDNKDLGEVAAFARDGSGKVTELHADIGGFLGIGEKRVRLMPSQFTLQGDRVMLNIASDEAKNLPAIPKN